MSDTASKPDRRMNPISDANFLSRLTFWWTRDIMHSADPKRNEKIETSNIPPVDNTDQCEKLVRDIEVSWDEEVSRYGLEKASFFRAVYKGVGLRYLTWSFLIFLEAGLMVFSPVALGRFLRYVTNRDEYSVQYGYGWAAGLVGTNLLFLFVHHHLFFTYWREGMRLRSIIQMMIFRKILTLSAPSLSKVGQGLLINMQGSDIVQIEDNVMFLLFIPVAILVLIACTAIIATYLDLPSALAAMGCIITLIPMQSIGTAIMNHFKVKANKNRDVRVKYVHEIMSSIRVVKMYGWEYAFDKKVTALRHEEMASVVRVNGIMGSILAYGYIAPVIAALFAFLTYTYRGGTLTPDRAFGTMSTIVPARIWMGVFAPAGFRSAMELRVIFNRLSTILKTPSNVESSYDAAEELDSTSATNMPLVELTSVTTAWVHSVKEMDNVPFILKDVSFSVKRGEIVAVIGCVGSGKSTLLTMLMHELPIRAPRRPRIHGRLAYVSQVPFMLTESVRFNIVFHREWDPEWYAKVCHACGLERDFNLWEYRDETLVGERGVTLSGGQRARLELARALYGRADIYLLDDPLSAVDASVGQHLFTEAIRGLMQDAAVVLVTHQKQFLPGVDRILVLDGGRVKKYGTFAELDPRCLDACDADNASDADKISPQEVLPTMPPLSADELPSATCENNKDLYSDDTVTEDAGHEQKCAIDEDVVVKEKIPEANVETRNTGSVSQSVYTQYLRSGFFDWMIGPVLLMIWFVVVTAPQAVLQVTDWWLSRWSIASAADQSQRIGFYAGSYGLLVLGTVVLAILRALFIVWTLTRAARRLHRRMLCSLLHTAMSFFDKTPSGQILNRFSMDMIIVDDLMVQIGLEFFQVAAQLSGFIIFIGVLNAWLFIAIVPLVIAFFYIRFYFITCAREMKRLQATSRSPILSLTSQTITGLYTIRTSGVGPALRKTMAKIIDESQAVNFAFLASQRWLGIRLETLNVIFLIVFTFLSAGGVGVGGPGSVAVSLVYIIQLLGLVQYGTRISAELEAYMTNVERVIAYTQLPPEEGYTSDQGRSIVGGKKKDATEVELSSIGAVWPHSGHIEFKDVSLRYAPEQALVLKNVTLSIPAQTKVGIVGRTGAGKSSLLAALFRLSPLEPGSRIIIDGTDINRIPLQELRSGLSIIPQEPLLFCASIWENLDPSKEYTEDDLWEALRKSRLHDYVRNLPGDLHHVVTESNFSIGQRHLLCLARALLRRSKVLIMDEATANIDLETDAVIQQCIRTCFADRTILTVAHRLDTIIDSDLIVTLEGGRVRAVGPPHVLLQDPAGAFTSLVTATGPQHEQRLRDLAAAAYGNKYNEGDK